MATSSERPSWAVVAPAALAIAVLVQSPQSRAAGPRFYPDDPIRSDNDRALDAGGVTPIEGSNGYDFAEHTFFEPGDVRDTPAVNVNTVGVSTDCFNCLV